MGTAILSQVPSAGTIFRHTASTTLQRTREIRACHDTYLTILAAYGRRSATFADVLAAFKDLETAKTPISRRRLS
jgi:hypothetical protein